MKKLQSKLVNWFLFDYDIKQYFPFIPFNMQAASLENSLRSQIVHLTPKSEQLSLFKSIKINLFLDLHKFLSP